MIADKGKTRCIRRTCPNNKHFVYHKSHTDCRRSGISTISRRLNCLNCDISYPSYRKHTTSLLKLCHCFVLFITEIKIKLCPDTITLHLLHRTTCFDKITSSSGSKFLFIQNILRNKSLPTKILYSMRATCPIPLLHLQFITLTILNEEYKLWRPSLPHSLSTPAPLLV
jgi:hypothetical protein